MARMMIPLEVEEKKVIFLLAQREKRDPRQQAALLIRLQLERLGLLQPAPTNPPIQESVDARQPA